MNIQYNQEEAAAEEEAAREGAREGEKVTNGDRDLRLLRCLQPCVPPSGSLCIVNEQRKGRLMIEEGFVEDVEKVAEHAMSDAAEQDHLACALPLGELRAITVHSMCSRLNFDGLLAFLLYTGEKREMYLVSPRDGNQEGESTSAEVRQRSKADGTKISMLTYSSLRTSPQFTILHAVPTEEHPHITAFHRRAQKLAPWFIESKK